MHIHIYVAIHIKTNNKIILLTINYIIIIYINMKYVLFNSGYC